VSFPAFCLPPSRVIASMLRIAAVSSLLTLTTGAQAQNYLEAFLTDYDGVSGTNLFVQHSLRDDLRLTVNAYRDDFYQSTYLGLSTTALLQDLELGLGVGQANVDARTNTASELAYNPWLWFQRGGFEAFAEAEVLQTAAQHYYYRAYLHQDIGSHFYLGYYSERDVGGGPLAGIKFESETAGIRLFGTIPSFNQPGDPADRLDYVMYFMGWLEF
jgi:hypothetical protein